MNSQWTSFSSKLQKTSSQQNASSRSNNTANLDTLNHDKAPTRSKLTTHEKAVEVVRRIIHGEKTLFKFVTYETYSFHHKLRSRAYKPYLFFVHANSVTSAGWIVCSYAMSSCCAIDKAVKVFDVTRGGTTSLTRHTELHERNKNASSFSVYHKLSNGERESIGRGAVMAVVKDIRPLGFAAKNSGLQAFVESVFRAGQRTAAGVEVDPSELMPSRQTVRNYLQQMASDARKAFARNALMRLLETGGGVTCDGLKHSITGTKFYDLIAHWIEFSNENIFTNLCDISIKSQVLLLVPVSGVESAENIKKVLNDALQERYGISLTRLLSRHTFVTDCANTLPCVVGASASSKKVPLSSIWMGCVCHQLNTCMKRVFDQNWSTEPFRTIQLNLQAAKNIVRIFKKSSVVLPSGLHLMQEVETRFSTTFLVVQRFLQCAHEIRSAILSMPTPSASLISAFGDLEYEVLQDGLAIIPALNAIYIVCKPLADMQKVMEASNKPTLYRLLPMMEHCKMVLLRLSEGNVLDADVPSGSESTRAVSCSGLYVRELAKVMLESVRRIEIHPLWCAGIILHPRLALMTCVRDQARREEYMRAGKSEIRKLMKVYNAPQAPFTVEESPTEAPVEIGDNENEREERRIRLATRNELQFSLETVLDCPSRSCHNGDELSKYIKSALSTDLSDLMAKDDLGALRWWVKMRGSYPILHKVALRVLSTPASSCASERNFSIVNNTVTAARSSLTNDAIEDLVFGKSVIENGYSF